MNNLLLLESIGFPTIILTGKVDFPTNRQYATMPHALSFVRPKLQFHVNPFNVVGNPKTSEWPVGNPDGYMVVNFP
jgi:hypothetical protein